MGLFRQFARLAYHATRSTVDRRHRLKYSQDFVAAMAIIGYSNRSENELADTILAHADDSPYDEDDIAEAVYYLASAGLDEEIPDVLPHVIDLAEYGLCDLSVAADTLTSIMFLFDVPVSEGDRVANHLAQLTTTTKLTVSEAARTLECLGPRARTIDNSLGDVSADVERVARHDWVQNQSREEMVRTIQRVLTRQYDAERRLHEGTTDE